MGIGSQTALRPVVEDLQRIFGDRFDSMVAYGWRRHPPVPSLVLVQSIALDDLNACSARLAAWHRAGAATPLLLTTTDFARSLDAFPIEYGEIIATHELVRGRDLFEGLSINREDLRRACEVQVKSHLIHLREDYLETAGRPGDVDLLVRESSSGFAGLIRQLARLDHAPSERSFDLAAYATSRIGLPPHTVGDLLALAENDGLPTTDGARIFPEYLATMERLADFVDRWREA